MTENSTDDLVVYYSEVAELMNLLGSMKIDEALDATENLAKSHPDKSEPYFFMGLLAYHFHDRGRAVEMLQKAHEFSPNVREYADTLANLLALMGKNTDSLYYAKLATALEPHPHITDLVPTQFKNYFQALSQSQPSFHYPTALALFNTHDIEKCINHCEMELRVNTDHHGAHDLIGRCYMSANDPLRARRAFQSAIHFAPEIESYRIHMAECLSHLGHNDQAMVLLRNLPAPADDEAAIKRLTSEIALYHQFPRVFSGPAEDAVKALAKIEPDIYKYESYALEVEKEKISIGYLGSRFDMDEDLAFFRAIIANHDRKRHDIHVFFNGANKKTTTQYMETLVDSWVAVHDVDDDTLFAIMQGNDLDVLFDLDGAYHARRSNILSAQPAKTMVCWPSPRARDDFSSVRAFANLTDADAVSPITREEIPNAPDVSPTPASMRGTLTFGAYADINAVNAETISLWSQVLSQAPNSQMLLVWEGQTPAETATMIADMFGDHGLSDRVLFHRHIPDDTVSPYGFSYYTDVDVLLDTAPSSAPLLLSEALWMGVPVISLAHDNVGLSSVGAHILHQAQKREWIAQSSDDYVAIATALGDNVAALDEIRQGLRDHVSAAPLFNPREATKSLEAYFKTIIDSQDDT